MSENSIPRPFYDSPWPTSLRSDAQALWDWHLHLVDARAPALDGEDLTAYFEAERDKVLAGDAEVNVVPSAVTEQAYRVVDEHDLPAELLAQQVMAARHLKEGLRFETTHELNAFVYEWAAPLALLLAKLAGAGHSWQERPIRELAKGFFLTGRMVHLADDLEQNHLFIPLADLAHSDVSVEQLERGLVDDGVRRLFWKQLIRAQDALAQGQDLVRELPRRYSNALKRYWLGALELLSEIERRDYDVWSEPIRLSSFRRIQVWLQSWLGAAASGR